MNLSTSYQVTSVKILHYERKCIFFISKGFFFCYKLLICFNSFAFIALTKNISLSELKRHLQHQQVDQ